MRFLSLELSLSSPSTPRQHPPRQRRHLRARQRPEPPSATELVSHQHHVVEELLGRGLPQELHVERSDRGAVDRCCCGGSGRRGEGLLGLLRAPRSPGGRTALRARPPSAAPRRWRCCGGDEQLLFPPSYLRQLLLWQLLPLLLLLLLLRERLISSSLAVAPLFVLRLPPLLRPRPLLLRLRLRSFRPRLLRQPPASPRRKRRRCPKATKRKSRSRKERVVVSLQLVPPLLLLDERGDCQSEEALAPMSSSSFPSRGAPLLSSFS